MPFVRFSRDKRGYEHLYLVEPIARRGKSRNWILYWYRTPPGVKIGRPPFDDLVRRTLEARHPDVSFDWQKLVDTPIPPPTPDVERWRERRRAEKAAKQAAAVEAATEVLERASEQASEQTLRTEELAASSVEVAEVADSVPVLDAGTPSGTLRRRRRRRGRRGRSDVVTPPAAAGESPSLADDNSAVEPDDSAAEPDEE